ncbi:MAG: 3-oxoacyl-[acyl-carrier-protein] synthase III C-terminal domain-containing protein [Candidatus Methylacidiphilales bacterium]|nr:3-oxoacyl-[acyl-carrier-protein] synthase III C-terminal domain-containing protein [Candidatus Methylacidiphilales bacterium]
MYLQALAHAVPPRSFSQRDIWDAVAASPVAAHLKPRSLTLLEKILSGDSGIEKRHLAFDDPGDVFLLDAEGLNRRFEATAPGLATSALNRALEQAGLDASSLDGIIVCTCTGYLCPGLTSFVSEQAGLRSDTWLSDLAGQGCGAAIPALRQAAHFLAAHPDARIATVAVEVCSAAFFLDDDPGVLISACLFGDGAAAAIWTGKPATNSPVCCDHFQTLHLPGEREKLRFDNAGGKLRNLLDRSVPGLAADSVAQLYHQRPMANGDTVLVHTGGKKVLEAIRKVLPDHPLAESEHILRDHGNMSSPSILFVLEEALKRNPRGTFWLTSFGAGFTCHACRIESTP